MFAQNFILPGVVSFLSEERLHNGYETQGAVSAALKKNTAGACGARRCFWLGQGVTAWMGDVRCPHAVGAGGTMAP